MVDFGGRLGVGRPLEGARSRSNGKTFSDRALNPVVTKHSTLLLAFYLLGSISRKKISKWKISPRKPKETSRLWCRMKTKPTLWEVVKTRSLEEILERAGPHLPMMLERICPIGLLITLT